MDPEVLKHTLVPIVAILTGLIAILMPVAIVWVVLHFRHQRQQAAFETVRRLAEQGHPVPPQLLEPTTPKAAGESALFRAFTLLGVGVGLAIMFYLLNLAFLSGIGALLVCIGVAQLIALGIERNTPGSPSA